MQIKMVELVIIMGAGAPRCPPKVMRVYLEVERVDSTEAVQDAVALGALSAFPSMVLIMHGEQTGAMVMAYQKVIKLA